MCGLMLKGLDGGVRQCHCSGCDRHLSHSFHYVRPGLQGLRTQFHPLGGLNIVSSETKGFLSLHKRAMSKVPSNGNAQCGQWALWELPIKNQVHFLKKKAIIHLESSSCQSSEIVLQYKCSLFGSNSHFQSSGEVSLCCGCEAAIWT